MRAAPEAAPTSNPKGRVMIFPCPSQSSARVRSASPPPRICWHAARHRWCWKRDRPAHAVRQWGHVRMFTPWQLLRRSRGGGARSPRGAGRTRRRMTFRPATNSCRVISNRLPRASRRYVQFNARVTGSPARAATRCAPPAATAFRSCCACRAGRPGRMIEAAAVIDASGTWSTPNPAGADGLPALGEIDAADRIAYGHAGCAGRGSRGLMPAARRPWLVAATPR